MAVNNEYPILNGIAPSWADIEIKATGTDLTLLEMKDVAAINTNTTIEVGSQRGASGGRVIRRTNGSKTDEASWTLYRSGLQILLRNLVTAAEAQGLVRGNQRLVGLVHFDLQISHTPFNDIEIYEIIVRGCRAMGIQANAAEGTDAQQIEFPLSPAEIVHIVDGKEVVLL